MPRPLQARTRNRINGPVISVEQLAKRYQLGADTPAIDSLRERLAVALTAPIRRLRNGAAAPAHPNRTAPPAAIWALKDVTFTVGQGEVVGLIGRNGAGKSTLLKILSRITEPTDGEARIKGRVASLLEVGTGFHPELTGRENVHLNGAILGMTRREVDERFDEIVDFAEIAGHIDTPVKRYSSGMYARLAFAVAAHLEPDVLLVDEVLAVGDAAFQKKCLGKMNEVAGQGRTVIFVSHNMGMITSLCPRAILLDGGRIASDGPAAQTVLHYYTSRTASPHTVDYTHASRSVGDDRATLLAAWIEDDAGTSAFDIDIRSPFRVKMRYVLHQPAAQPPYPNFHFYDSRGECAFVTMADRQQPDQSGGGVYVAECRVPANLLNNGTYYIGVALTFPHPRLHVSFYERDALAVSLRDPIGETLDTARNGFGGAIPGVVRPRLEWQVERES